MTAPILCTLRSLQDHVSRQLDRESAGQPEPQDVLETQARRHTSDLATSLAVKWLAENKPAPTPQAHRQMRRYVRLNMKRLRRERQNNISPDKCGFAFLILLLTSIFSWIIQRVLDAVWDNYRNNPQATAVYGGMAQSADVVALCGVARQPGPGDFEDDTDDTDDPGDAGG